LFTFIALATIGQLLPGPQPGSSSGSQHLSTVRRLGFNPVTMPTLAGNLHLSQSIT
jgi:hypothetical protein